MRCSYNSAYNTGLYLYKIENFREILKRVSKETPVSDCSTSASKFLHLLMFSVLLQKPRNVWTHWNRDIRLAVCLRKGSFYLAYANDYATFCNL